MKLISGPKASCWSGVVGAVSIAITAVAPNAHAQAPAATPRVSLATAERWGTAWCWPDKGREPGLPIDDTDTTKEADKRARALIDALVDYLKTLQER